jgi:hypothetical protein
MRKFDIAQCLLDHGADVSRIFVNCVRYFPVGQPATTVLGSVLQGGSLSSLACISFLLKAAKASPYANCGENFTVLHRLGQPMRTSTSGAYNDMFVREAFRLLHNHFHFSKEILNARWKGDGVTALELAVYNEEAGLVEELVLAGADWDVVEPHPKGKQSALMLAMKMLYCFPKDVRIEEGNCPSREEQLDQAFNRRRHIALILCRKARDQALVTQRNMTGGTELSETPRQSFFCHVKAAN